MKLGPDAQRYRAMGNNTAKLILVLTFVIVIGVVAWCFIAKMTSWIDVFHGSEP